MCACVCVCVYFCIMKPLLSEYSVSSANAVVKRIIHYVHANTCIGVCYTQYNIRLHPSTSSETNVYMHQQDVNTREQHSQSF